MLPWHDSQHCTPKKDRTLGSLSQKINVEPSCYRPGVVPMTRIEPREQRQMDLRSDLGTSDQHGLAGLGMPLVQH